MSQADLFAPSEAVERPAVRYMPGLLNAYTLEQLLPAIPFRQNTANMYGREVLVPRLECWFGSRPYAFGGRVEEPRPMPPLVEMIRGNVKLHTGIDFDSCFANLYRTGDDCISWHADDDDWIGPVIASVSFGAARRFVMRKKNNHEVKAEWSLGHGDLLVMLAGVQEAWEHRVPREAKVNAPRLNLTFRTTIERAR